MRYNVGMKDQKEIELMLAGDKSAFGKFYERTKPKLLGYVHSKVGIVEDVDEVVQDTYLAFLDSLPLFQKKSSLKTFLWSIARHEVADYWRKKYAKKAIRTVPFVDQVYTEKLYSSVQTAAAIKLVYEKLKPSEVQLLKMKYERGMSVGEIAQELKVSVKAAESKLFRARKSFQYAYENYED